MPKPAQTRPYADIGIFTTKPETCFILDMDRPEKLQRLAAQRSMLSHAVAGMADDIDRLNLRVAEVTHELAQVSNRRLNPAQEDPRRVDLQRELDKCEALLEAARDQRNAIRRDLQALTVTVSRLDSWWRSQKHQAVRSEAQ